MNRKEFLEKIEQTCGNRDLSDNNKLRVVVKAEKAGGSAGATPSSEVTNICKGFDWDSGTLIITTEDDLMIQSDMQKKMMRLAAEVLNAYYIEITKQGGYKRSVMKSMVKGAVEDIFPDLKEKYTEIAKKTDELAKLARLAREEIKNPKI